MIHEVDEALRDLVRGEALRGSDVEVVFEAPTKDWAARRNAPTINLYLYDLREDIKRKTRGLINEYGPNGQVVARHKPPRYFKLSYLLTAWTQRAEDEHRLLSEILLSIMRYEAVPKRFLRGSLVELDLTVPLSIALPPPEDRSFADVWSAMGGELKPSLDIVVTVPVKAGPPIPVAATASEGMDLSTSDTGKGPGQ